MENNIIPNTINIAEQSVNVVENIFKDSIIFVLNILKTHSTGLLRFLFDKNLIQMGIGIMVATQVSKLTSIITDNIISPIINKLTGEDVAKFEDYTYTLFGINFKLGIVITNLVNCLLVLLIIYNIYQLSKITDFSFLGSRIDKIIPDKTRVNINVST